MHGFGRLSDDDDQSSPLYRREEEDDLVDDDEEKSSIPTPFNKAASSSYFTSSSSASSAQRPTHLRGFSVPDRNSSHQRPPPHLNPPHQNPNQHPFDRDVGASIRTSQEETPTLQILHHQLPPTTMRQSSNGIALPSPRGGGNSSASLASTVPASSVLPIGAAAFVSSSSFSSNTSDIDTPTAPRLPSRRNSLFHEEYVATKGYTSSAAAVPTSSKRHGRSHTMHTIQATPSPSFSSTHGGPLASAGQATIDFASMDLLSPHTVESVDVLPLLRRGTYLLKFARNGTPKFRYYSLSEDALTISAFDSFRDVGRKAPTKSIDLRTIDRLQLGQASARFRGITNELSDASFSIHLRSTTSSQSDASLDPLNPGPALIASTMYDYHIWTRGIVHLHRLLQEIDRKELMEELAAPKQNSGKHSRKQSTAPLSESWPPPSLHLPIPAVDIHDRRETDFTLIKGSTQKDWRKVKQEIEEQAMASVGVQLGF